MESYLYRHLKVLEDDGNILLEGLQLDHAMIARYPSYAQGNFTAEDIRYAIEETFQFKIHPQRITPYNGEYLIQAPSAVSECLLLTRGSIPLLECNLALIPWTKEYGSIMVPLRTQLSDLGTIDFDAITWNIQNQRQQIRSDEAINIDISGIPPHLCSNKTVKTLLSEYCSIDRISIIRYDCSVQAYATSDITIPRNVHLGVKKQTTDGLFIKIWPIWFRTYPDFDAQEIAYQDEIQAQEYRGMNRPLHLSATCN